MRVTFLGSGDAFGSGGRFNACIRLDFGERSCLVDFDKKVKWHLDYATLMSHLGGLSARRIVLTHMGPEMLSRLSDVALECAEDGMAIEV